MTAPQQAEKEYIINKALADDVAKALFLSNTKNDIDIMNFAWFLTARPLSPALKAEREKVLDKIIDKLMENPLSDCGIDSMNRMGRIVESLRREP